MGVRIRVLRLFLGAGVAGLRSTDNLLGQIPSSAGLNPGLVSLFSRQINRPVDDLFAVGDDD